MGQVHTPIGVAGQLEVIVTAATTTYSSVQFSTDFLQRTGIIRGIRVPLISSIAGGMTTLTFKVTSDSAGNLILLGEQTTLAVVLSETGPGIGGAFTVGLEVPFLVPADPDALPYLWAKTDSGTCSYISIEYLYEVA